MIGKTEIPLQEVNFHSMSFKDPVARVFWWNQELYRGISEKRAKLYEGLFQDGTVEHLIEKGLLIKTELTPFAMEGYPLIVKHRILPFVSFAYEWSSLMLKEAALSIIDLEIELGKRGLTLQDSHPWNILFDGYKPVWIDFGSILPSGSASADNWWPAYGEFRQFFLYPLQIMSQGHPHIARYLLMYTNLHEPEIPALIHKPSLARATKQMLRMLLTATEMRIPASLRPVFKKVLSKLEVYRWKAETRKCKSRFEFLCNVRREVEAITLSSGQTEWTGYDSDLPHEPFPPVSDWPTKAQSVYRVLSETKPRTVLDYACNRGWYSKLAAHLGSTVVGLDSDEQCVNELFSAAKEKNLSVLSLVMDCRYPSPAIGIGDGCYGGAAPQRLRSEMVIALAIVHHLVFKAQFSFHQIVEALSDFAEKWLLVELPLAEDSHVSGWYSDNYSWYTLKNFEEALRGRFNRVTILPSSDEHRVLLLCEK